jgi:DNA-binding NarL/FixJ family response regulator
VGLTRLPRRRTSATLPYVASRILIVDDSEYFRVTARELLAARGFELFAAAADGEAALAAVSRGCPDGILLDINLPGRDGIAVAVSLIAACPSARIVLTSSDVDDVPGEVLADCGAVAFVPKTELAVTELEQLFNGHPPQAAGTAPPPGQA